MSLFRYVYQVSIDALSRHTTSTRGDLKLEFTLVSNCATVITTRLNESQARTPTKQREHEAEDPAYPAITASPAERAHHLSTADKIGKKGTCKSEKEPAQ